RGAEAVQEASGPPRSPMGGAPDVQSVLQLERCKGWLGKDVHVRAPLDTPIEASRAEEVMIAGCEQHRLGRQRLERFPEELPGISRIALVLVQVARTEQRVCLVTGDFNDPAQGFAETLSASTARIRASPLEGCVEM